MIDFPPFKQFTLIDYSLKSYTSDHTEAIMANTKHDELPKLLVCNSGGKTSAYMTYRLISDYRDKYDILVVFANTGQENDETLDFIYKCDIEFGLNTIWVEAKVNEGSGNGTTHTVVDYNSADRKGKVFESIIKKYGIPNKSYPHCTRELKERAIHSFIKTIGWVRGNYTTAIGIRTDETRRVRKTKDYQNIVYPLVDWFPADKDDINDFWDNQDFNLELPEHKGNCKWCWKKSLKKHAMIVKENPNFFWFPMEMERKYPHAGHNDGIRKRVFFRGNMSTVDLLNLINEVKSSDTLTRINKSDDGCSESCEAFDFTEINND